mmetsp:Transcript_51168/g.59787  ORF Transcript_51168/g.59787 Transcript_51168/m.59787 type:complete len:97 (+) Transcript_51168:63-353(+)
MIPSSQPLPPNRHNRVSTYTHRAALKNRLQSNGAITAKSRSSVSSTVITAIITDFDIFERLRIIKITSPYCQEAQKARSLHDFRKRIVGIFQSVAF